MSGMSRQGSLRHTTRAGKAAVVAVSLPVGACLMAVAIASTEHAWLGWFALVPLFTAIRLWRPFRALLAGALWGASLYVSCVIQPHGVVPAGIGIPVLLTLAPALYACFGSWLTRRIGFNPFVLAVAWMAVELAFGAAGPHIGLLGGAAGTQVSLSWAGQAFGYVVAAFIVAFLGASLVHVFGAPRPVLRGPSYSILTNGQRRRLSPQTFFYPSLCEVHPRRTRAPPAALSEYLYATRRLGTAAAR